LNLRVLFSVSLALVSVIPVGILGFWQYRLVSDDKTGLSADQQQVIDYLTTYTESFSEAILTIGLLGIVIALVLGWWLSGIILKPVRELENTANTIAKGDLSTRVPDSSKYEPSEFRNLGHSFDQMIEQLSKNNAELNAAREKAENINQSKSKFLSAMGHELRTPLNSIIGFSQILSLSTEIPLTEKQETMVINIANSGHHLSKLINQILDLAQIDKGKLDFILGAVNPAEVIELCVDNTLPLAESGSISIANNMVAKNLPVIQADATRFKQVLLNLLSNAVNYSHANGTVTLNTAVTTNRMLRISISDNGPGIPKVAYDKVFAPFERLDTKAGDHDGTGIGLTISKQLVESMNGNIGFESEIGKGSTFWIDIPIMQEAEKPEVVSAKPASPAPQPQSAKSSDLMRRVLYIEDNMLNVQLMELIFESVPNAELTIAMTGEQGVKLAKEISPDLILMDIFLPGMDGIEASRLLKDSNRTTDIPIIAISAATWNVDVERARDVGFFAYLTKPIDISETLSTIQKALGSGAQDNSPA
jgi:signal transduction histidine kinase/CheY-like chemotaxis protein